MTLNTQGITPVSGGVTAPRGFSACGLHAGIRKNKSKKDVALIFCEKKCVAAAVYTRNLVQGAPIAVTRRNIADGMAQALICNSGNANTCNADGEEKAAEMCKIAAAALNISPQDVIVASTGVIGQVLPIEPFYSIQHQLRPALCKEGGADAAEAILTTDTRKKELAFTFEEGGITYTLGGIAKGSGMIHPNMATMLAFLTTDAPLASDTLSAALRGAVEDTFNMISVDGDTSTNDMVSIMASGLAGGDEIRPGTPAYEKFAAALFLLCRELAKAIAADGEGATRLVECRVTGAADRTAARTVAKAVICSSLVKAALFGADANWGRILCAAGYAGVPLDVNRVDVAFQSSAGRISVCENGAGLDFSEELAKEILSRNEILIDVTLGDGSACASAWGCDLTYDYVRINGDYRT